MQDGVVVTQGALGGQDSRPQTLFLPVILCPANEGVLEAVRDAGICNDATPLFREVDGIGHWMSQECGCDGILMQMVDATSLLFTCDKKWDDVVASTTECCDEFWLMAISKAIEGVEGGHWVVMFEGRRVRG
jgi:hypothetical protein